MADGEGVEEENEDNKIKRNVDPLRLSSCHLIEVLADDSLLWTWSYPHLSPQLRTVCTFKCKEILRSQGQRRRKKKKKKNSEVEEPQSSHSSQPDDDREMMQGRSFHLDQFWFYPIFPSITEQDNRGGVPGDESESQVKMVGVVIVAEDFYPEMYEAVGYALYLTFMKTGDASIVLQQFLSLVVDGSCLLPKKKKLTLSDYSCSSQYDKHDMIKEIISRFGLETILIYTALQRRRRILVYHYDIDVLSDFTLCLPVLCGDVSNEIWSSIYPWVDLNDEELDFIKNIPFYVMGCTVAGVESNSDLFDVFVNVPAAEISVAPHARESIAMTKAHKEAVKLDLGKRFGL